MEVELFSDETQTSRSRAVLKLFDRRFASQVRADYKIGPLTIAKEKAFSHFVNGGHALQFLDRLRNDDDFEEPEEGWDMGQNEVYLYDLCHSMYETELEVYKTLQKLQGQEIPLLLGAVRLQPSSTEGGTQISKEGPPSSSDATPDSSIASSRQKQNSLEEKSTSMEHENSSSLHKMQKSLMEITSSPTTKLFEVEGLLLEYIEGYTLSEMANLAPMDDWGRICDQAVKVIRLLDDYSIRNEDVRPSNVMVSPTSSESYRIVMLDFAQCSTLR